MTTTKKEFDCIAMKRQGAQAVRAHLKEKTRDERIAYWHERTRALRERQADVSPDSSFDDE
jgi:hypothetical protein